MRIDHLVSIFSTMSNRGSLYDFSSAAAWFSLAFHHLLFFVYEPENLRFPGAGRHTLSNQLSTFI